VSASSGQQREAAAPHADAAVAAVRPTRGQRLARRVLPLVIASTVYFGFIVYPPLRILGLAFPHWQPQTPELLVLMAGPLLIRIACEWIKGPLGRVLSGIVMTWLGICFMAFGLVVAWEIANLALDLPARPSGIALGAIVLVLAAYGWVNAHRLSVREVPVPLAHGAPEAARGTRLAQISDVHVGTRSGRFLHRIVERINRLDADYVVITGDFIDVRNVSERELASLALLTRPTFYVIGNHERYVDLDAICRRMTNLGVRVLRNESLSVGPFQFVGIDDAEPKTQVASKLPALAALPDAYRILLYHRPDGTREAAHWGAHLMLSGHTHNGQIVPFNFIVRRVFPKIHGLYRIGEMYLHVSPGTGTWGPVLRLGSRCEIGLIHLQ
jgi:predicted MPP superfamily phosphohydrolase